MSHQDSDGRAGHAIARWVAGATVALLATPALPGAAASPHAAVAPRGILAFHSDAGGVSGLYVMNADGSRVRLVSSTLAGFPFSKWSPDGRRLAFLGGTYGIGGLYVTTLSGTEHRVGSHIVRAPIDWSPDGRQLVYETERGVIFSARGDGQARPRRLGRGAAPVWSPDGKCVLYFFGPRNRTDLYKVDLRTLRRTRLTTNPGFDHSPQWSPDGRRIAFVSERDGNSELYLLNADGSRLRRLTRDPNPDEAFAWSPDGTRLVYVAYRDGADPHSIGIGNAEVETVDTRSGRVRNLSRHRAWDGDPSWSPDGRWIVFTRRTNHGEVAVMRADGTQPRLLRGAARPNFNDCCATWRPSR